MSKMRKTRELRTPADLADTLRDLKAAVLTKELVQIRPDLSPFATNMPVEDIDADGPWPDYIELRFRDPSNGTIYRLSVETYHGGGGAWEID